MCLGLWMAPFIFVRKKVQFTCRAFFWYLKINLEIINTFEIRPRIGRGQRPLHNKNLGFLRYFILYIDLELSILLIIFVMKPTFAWNILLQICYSVVFVYLYCISLDYFVLYTSESKCVMWYILYYGYIIIMWRKITFYKISISTTFWSFTMRASLRICFAQ